MVRGMKPWVDISYFYALMTIMLSVLVASTVGSEFIRGGLVIARHHHSNIFHGMYLLTRRNTRRYGGYIVHLGVIVTMIGFAGVAFYQNTEQELGFGDKMAIGPYTLVCRSYTQNDQAELFQRMGHSRHLQEWEADYDDVSGAALLQGERAAGDHRCQPLDGDGGFVPGVHGQESG